MMPRTRILRVTHPNGLHLRPANAIVAAIQDHPAQITFRKGDKVVDAKSILDLLALGAGENQEIVVTATGPEADMALETITPLI